MARKCRLLVAATEVGYAHIRRALNGDFDIVVAYTRSQAIGALKEGVIDAILCSIHFDESRMLELLMAAKEAAPGVPFICCQILRSTLRPSAIQITVSAAESQGALGFIDYNAVLRTRGAQEADRYLREELARLLPPTAGAAAVAGM